MKISANIGSMRATKISKPMSRQKRVKNTSASVKKTNLDFSKIDEYVSKAEQLVKSKAK